MSQRAVNRSIAGAIVGLLVLGGASLVISGINPFALVSSADGPQTNDSSVPFANGELQYYFSDRELGGLGLNDEIDSANVRYRSDLALDEFSSGCASKDCILSIDDPSFGSTDDANSWLSESDRVIAISISESARAYPFRILNYHEVVNDRIDGVPIAITYCPLCRSALVFNRPTHNSSRLTFGVAGRLYKDNLILYDRQTATYWSQLQARPIVGPLVGRGLTLERRAMDIMTWRDWRAQYPNGQVLARPQDGDALGGEKSYSRPTVPSGAARQRGGGSSGNHLFDYNTDPYADYAADPQARAEDFDDDRLASKAVVIGVEMDSGPSVAVPEDRLEQGETLEVSVDGRTVVVTQSDGGDLRARSQRDGERHELAVSTAYWFAWLSFHPDTVLYEGSS